MIFVWIFFPKNQLRNSTTNKTTATATATATEIATEIAPGKCCLYHIMPYILLVFWLLFYLLCCFWVDFLERISKQKLNWRLSLKNWNKRTGEIIIIHTPSEALINTYPVLLVLLLPLFYFLCCWCVDCLKTSTIKNETED